MIKSFDVGHGMIGLVPCNDFMMIRCIGLCIPVVVIQEDCISSNNVLSRRLLY